MNIDYESTSAERMCDELLKEFIVQARLKLNQLLADEKEVNKSWINIKGKRYMLPNITFQFLIFVTHCFRLLCYKY